MTERKSIRLPARILLIIAAMPGVALLMFRAASAFSGSFSLEEIGQFTDLYALVSLVLLVVAVRGRFS